MFFKKMTHKILTTAGLFCLMVAAFVTVPQTHAAQNLGEVFNFFGVKCLIPDGANFVDRGVDSLPFKHKQCKNGGASLLDQAVGFLYSLGPILAVIVVIWGGYLYYNSVFDGDDKRAIQTVRAGVVGLAIILSVPMIYGIFQDLSGAGSTSQSLFDKLTQTLVGQVLKPIANAGMVLGAAVAVVSFIFAGYQYLLGDAKKGAEALRNAFIGLIVTLVAVAIVALIQNVFGFVF